MKISVQRYRATDMAKNLLKKRIISSKSFVPILFGASIIILACLLVWQRVYVIGLVTDVSQYEKENRQLKDLVKKSEMKTIELSRLSRIEKIAKERLGLQKTGAGNIFTVKLNGSEIDSDGIGDVVSSLKKIADNLPVLNETKAETFEIIEFDEN